MAQLLDFTFISVFYGIEILVNVKMPVLNWTDNKDGDVAKFYDTSMSVMEMRSHRRERKNPLATPVSRKCSLDCRVEVGGG